MESDYASIVAIPISEPVPEEVHTLGRVVSRFTGREIIRREMALRTVCVVGPPSNELDMTADMEELCRNCNMIVDQLSAVTYVEFSSYQEAEEFILKHSPNIVIHGHLYCLSWLEQLPLSLLNPHIQ